MKVSSSCIPRLLLVCLIFSLFCQYATCAEYASNYIIRMDKSVMPTEFSTYEQWYKSVVSSVKSLPGSLVKEDNFYHYTYDTVIQGFSAGLTQSELDTLEEMSGHVMSFPDPVGQFHTTHSTEFLGLGPINGLLPASRFGQDVIVAMMDSGVWPESESFNDQGMEPVPARWKGTCENGTAFDPSLSCNRKLIGARSFKKGAVAKYGPINKTDDYDSARDFFGHGSHTSSTAGGNYVSNVSFHGYAPGIARGVAPAARVAMYKIGWSIGIAGSDVLAGMESAINDGADVLSLSLGFEPTPYFNDVVALGAFAAIKKGVVVVCSAGNGGPWRQTVANGAPWILTVGASTIDRGYEATLKLGDGSVVLGSSSYYSDTTTGNFKISSAPLAYDIGDSACTRSLVPEKVNGTVALCTNVSSDIIDAAQSAGALALLMVTDQPNYLAVYPSNEFPTLYFNALDGTALAKYSSSAANPVVEVDFGVTVLGIKPAPVMAHFSSRGPNIQGPNILKPDITAPGVSILAAWAAETPRDNYAMISGTSMSCPHVAGVSALLKAVHSEWSPAAIRSAMMTTSYTLDNNNITSTDGSDGQPATPLDFGAGHVDPNKAVDPGLVYDIGAEDYINYLCTLKYTTQQTQLIAGVPVSCPTTLGSGSDGLNYPTFTAVFDKSATSSYSATFKRTLTNVGEGTSYYKAVVQVPNGFRVEVNPSTLQFTEKFQKQNFTLTMEVEVESSTDVVYGFISWIDQIGHVVKSPVVALFE